VSVRSRALIALLVAGLACRGHRAGDEGDEPGRLQLGVQVPDGVVLSTLRYRLDGPFGRQSADTVTVPQPLPPVLVTVPGLVAGHHQLQLDGAATAGQSCQALTSFNVMAGRTTKLVVTLECHGVGPAGMFEDGGSPSSDGGLFARDGGQPSADGATPARDSGGAPVDMPSGNNVQVNVTIDNCPTITAFSIAPTELAVGAAAAVSARATDEGDAPPGLQWSAATGAFDDPHAADTQFHCLVPGVVTVAFIASDRHCQELTTVDVTCLATDSGVP
jgi:hypothetical protein